MPLEFQDKPRIGIMRKIFGYSLFGFGCCCIFVLDQVDIIMNSSHSLEEPAFAVIEHPVFLYRGAIVAANMPDALRDTFGDYHYVKRIGGMPGDIITYNKDGTPCINDVCYQVADNALSLPTIAPGVIPADYYALVGTAPDSLDSRYATIGLIAEDDLVGRGWALPFMSDWRGLSE